jgi:hypothetical protein
MTNRAVPDPSNPVQRKRSDASGPLPTLTVFGMLLRGFAEPAVRACRSTSALSRKEIQEVERICALPWP